MIQASCSTIWRWASLVLLLVAAPLLIGCGRGAATSSFPTAEAISAPTVPPKITPTSASVVAQPSIKAADPTVILHTSQGDIKLRLFAQQAPRTVENFLENYASRGFYDQTIFHHLEPGVMLIGG